MRLTLSAPLVLAAAFALARPASADLGPALPPGPPPIDRVIAQHAAELGIDDATLQQILDTAELGRQAAVPLQQAVVDARAQLQVLLQAEPPDAGAIHAQLAVISAAQLALDMERMDTILAIRALLTPDQWAQLQQLLAQGMGPRTPDGPRPGGHR